MLSNCQMLIYIYIMLSILNSSITQITQHSLSHLSKCNANFTLAGFFNLHEQRSLTEACSKGKLDEKSLYRALAMIYTVSKINNDGSLLPGITLAVEITDICYSLDVAIRSYLGLDFVSSSYQISSQGWSQFHGNNERKPGPTFAVIGTGTTMITNSLSTLSNQFDVPVISFSATSPLLSNKDRFKSFFRTVPNDNLIADMIVNLLEKFKWHLVSVIYTDTDYGMTAFAAFQQKLNEAGRLKGIKPHTCLAYTAEFSNDESRNANLFDGKSSEFNKSNVIVVFAHTHHAKTILEKALEHKINDKIWILTDMSIESKIFCGERSKQFFGKIIIISFKNAQNALFTDFIMKNVMKQKEQELSKILPEIKEFDRRFQDNKSDYRSLEIPSNMNYVIDAVNAAANALHIALKCNNTRCLPVEYFSQKHLLHSLYKVNFTSQIGHQVSFDKNGDTGGTYIVHLLSSRENRICKFEKLGEWRGLGSNRGFLELDVSIAKQHISSCRRCPQGWGRLPIEAGSCCWTCEKCSGNEYKSKITRLCETCPVNSLPDSKHTRCIMLIMHHISLTDDNLGIAVLCMSTAGLLFVVVILCILYKHRNTHLVRASSKELTAVLLLGIALGFAAPLFGIIAKNTWTCQLYAYIYGLSFSLMIGALFTKVNRISRIFHKKVLRTGKLKFMTVKWQMFFTSIFVILEMAMVTLLVFYPYDSTKSIAVKNDHHIHLHCHVNSQMLIGLMSFNGVLALLCTYQAFISRKLPDEYSESQSIFIVMIFIMLQNIAVIVTLFYAGGDFNPVMISVPDYLNAATVTVVLFGYKLYVILFKPDQNRIPNPHGSLGTFVSVKRKRKRTLSRAKPDNDLVLPATAIGHTNSTFEGAE